MIGWISTEWAYQSFRLRLRRYCWQCDRIVWFWHRHPHRYVVIP